MPVRRKRSAISDGIGMHWNAVIGLSFVDSAVDAAYRWDAPSASCFHTQPSFIVGLKMLANGAAEVRAPSGATHARTVATASPGHNKLVTAPDPDQAAPESVPAGPPSGPAPAGTGGGGGPPGGT